ncbi:wax ester/triacylglycerol synthase domain-containing protein [Nocardia jiangxiensis]|uniref:Wax ester/triacylglycerol synthase domain-containing protein n=1 Tax=Nocardia jiangxiensis TaxID=282685 RepID=A0ABW6S039_9NOCA
MRESQLMANDAAFFYLARSGRMTDWPMWWVFDSGDGPAPTGEQVTEYFGARAAALEPLRRRIVEAPGGLTHPFWAIDDSSIESHVVTHPDGLDWAACQDRMAKVLTEPLDARVCAWRLHVFPGVRGIGTLSGAGTVVMMHTSHALLAGPAMTSLGEALFAADPAPVRIEGQPSAARHPRLWPAVVADAIRIPWRTVRFLAGARALSRRTVPEGEADWSVISARTRTVLNQRIGPDRALRTVPLDLASVRTPGVTVTAIGLTAISLALQRYFDEHTLPCPEDLSAFVTIAIPGEQVLGVNRIGADVVDLHPGETDIAARARAVDETLRARRGSASSPRELARLQLIDGLPSRTYRTKFGTLPPADPPPLPPAHTILTSIRCDSDTALSLLDSRFRFAGMLPPVYPDIALAHSFVGAGDVFAVSVACDPAIVTDPDVYCDLLRKAFAELAALA